MEQSRGWCTSERTMPDEEATGDDSGTEGVEEGTTAASEAEEGQEPAPIERQTNGRETRGRETDG